MLSLAVCMPPGAGNWVVGEAGQVRHVREVSARNGVD